VQLESLTWPQTLLVYVGIPVAIYALIWFLWALPGWMHKGAYRPGEPWLASPEWIGGPPSVEGRELAALEAGATTGAQDAPQGGGTSARW